MEKIVIVFVHHSVKRGGGSEQVLYDLIQGLDKDKFRPVLCCLYGLGELGEQLKAEGVHTYQNLVRTPYDPRNILKITSILKQEQADMLYVSDAFHNVIVGRTAAFLARTPLSVLIFHTYDTVIRQGAGALRRAILELTDKLFYPHFHKAIALAETHKQYLISTKHISAERIAVVYNGIDLDPFDDPIDTSAVRRSWQIPTEVQIVGIVAGLRGWKAHDMFLKAAALTLQEAPSTFFVIAGDGPERGKLEQLAGELGIVERVRFLGVVANVPAILKTVDVSVLSSVHEALPLTLLEAMAAARPVVATDVGSVCEIIEDGVNGFLVPSGATEQFAQAILRLLRDPDLARRFGQAGRKKVEQKFTVERMVSRCEALFTEWLDSTEPLPTTLANHSTGF